MAILKHDRDKVGDFQPRVLLHIPVGIFNALLILVHWTLVLTFMYMFWKYQRNEDAHTEDQAWKDIFGWLIGFGIGSVALFIWSVAYRLYSQGG